MLCNLPVTMMVISSALAYTMNAYVLSLSSDSSPTRDHIIEWAVHLPVPIIVWPSRHAFTVCVLCVKERSFHQDGIFYEYIHQSFKRF